MASRSSARGRDCRAGRSSALRCRPATSADGSGASSGPGRAPGARATNSPCRHGQDHVDDVTRVMPGRPVHSSLLRVDGTEIGDQPAFLIVQLALRRPPSSTVSIGGSSRRSCSLSWRGSLDPALVYDEEKLLRQVPITVRGRWPPGGWRNRNSRSHPIVDQYFRPVFRMTQLLTIGSSCTIIA